MRIDLQKLLQTAISVHGLTRLAEKIQWQKGAAGDAAAGRRPIGPYRAAQIAQLIGEDPTAAALSALAEQAREPDESRFWQTLLAGGEPKQMHEIAVREIVADALGPKYVFAVASGISRYLHDTGALEGATLDSVRELAARAKKLFDRYESEIFGPGAAYKVSIGGRRDWINRHLAGEDVTVEIDRLVADKVGSGAS